MLIIPRRGRRSTMKKTAERTPETPETSKHAGCASSLVPHSFYNKQWFKTASLLKSDPSLVTNKILILALKNHAPLHAIKFFLGINPKAAGIPKEGPTPLQVAVQYNASIDVIRELIQACPFALIVTTSAECLDPLTYARRFRASEEDLIALLSRPLGSWIHPKEKEEADRKERDLKRTPAPSISPCALISPSPPAHSMLLPKLSVNSSTSNEGRGDKPAKKEPRKLDFSGADKQELKNVKQLCLTVLKGQKRLVREVVRVKENVQKNSELAVRTVPTDDSRVSIQQVQEIAESQKRNLKAHLIALDMKEQAMRAYVRRMEQKVLLSLDASKREYNAERYEGALKGLRDQLHLAARRMDNFIGTMENRLAEYGVRLDHEATVNAHFRSGVQHHLCSVPPPDASLQEGFEIISVVKNTPVIFATPNRKQKAIPEEEQPLFPKGDNETIYHSKSCTSWPKFLRRRRVLK